MQVSVENTGPLERKLKVEVPEEKISAEVQNRLQTISRTSKIQGFRPGKAPFRVIEKHYGNRVRQEVVGELVQSTFYEAITKEKLRPASNPDIDPLTDNKGSGLSYTATFEILPEVKLANLESLSVEKPVCEITDADIDKMIEVIRKQQSSLNPVDHEAKSGDFVKIDFTGTLNGEEFEGGKATDYTLELGAGRFIKGFEEGLVGCKAGDLKTLKIDFPKDYFKEDLAGKPVEFAVTVKEVNEMVLPELDDQLFIRMGVKEGGLTAFRDEIRRNMEREVAQGLSNQAKTSAFDVLFKSHEFELPKSLVAAESRRLNQQYHMQLQMRGLHTDHQHNEEEELKAFTTQAQRNVTLQLVISEIVKTNNIKVEKSRVRELIENIARSYEDPGQVVQWYYADQKRVADVEALALEDEVVNWLLQRAKITEKKFSFDDIMNKRQTESAETR